MVCRENKLRSVMLRMNRENLRAQGLTGVTPAEVESALHETVHLYKGAKEPTPQEYLALLEGMKAEIIANPRFTDADKYRPDTGARSQVGLVTRLDQEIERYKTGMYTDPATGEQRPLTSAQMNTAQFVAATQRIFAVTSRMQAAKSAYIGTYARHMGMTYDDAAARYDELNAMKPDERAANKHISHTDTWRQDLEIAGMSGEQLNDLSASASSRETIRIMESERRRHISTLPQRPTIRAEHRMEVLSPDDPAVKVQCIGGCGQFGHPASDCPNKEQVAAVDQAADAYQQKRAAATTARVGLAAQKQLAALEAGTDLDTQPGPDGTPIVVLPNGDHRRTDDPDLEAWLRAAKGTTDWDQKKVNTAVRSAQAARRARDKAQDELDEARGPIPHVSDYIEQAAYNPDAGVLQVTLRGYRNKAGAQSPSHTYVKHVSPDEWRSIESQPNWSAAVSNTVFRRASAAQPNANDAYSFATTADERAALTERRCPTCQQWASLNSTHTCPVQGSPSDRKNTESRAQSAADTDDSAQAAYNKAIADETNRNRLAKLPQLRIPDGMPRAIAVHQEKMPMDGYGAMTMPHRKEAEKRLDNGEVTLGEFNASYQGHKVTGRVAVWKEPSKGTRVLKVDKTKCDCGEDNCIHLKRAIGGMSPAYQAYRTDLNPGMPINLDSARPDADQVATTYNHAASPVTYKRARSRYQKQANRWVTSGAGVNRLPLNAVTPDGQRVPSSRVPKVWQDNDTQVDVSNPFDTAQYLTNTLAEKAPGKFQVVARPDGSVKITQDPVGGLRPNGTPRHQLSPADRHELATILRMPTVPADGYEVPPTRAWRLSVLDRVAGRPATWSGEGFIAAGPHADESLINAPA